MRLLVFLAFILSVWADEDFVSQKKIMEPKLPTKSNGVHYGAFYGFYKMGKCNPPSQRYGCCANQIYPKSVLLCSNGELFQKLQCGPYYFDYTRQVCNRTKSGVYKVYSKQGKTYVKSSMVGKYRKNKCMITKKFGCCSNKSYARAVFYCANGETMKKQQCGRYFFNPRISDCKQVNSIYGVYPKALGKMKPKNYTMMMANKGGYYLGKCYPSERYGCCNNRIYPRSVLLCWKGELHQKRQCGHYYYNHFTQQCTNGKVLEGKKPVNTTVVVGVYKKGKCYPTPSSGCCENKSYLKSVSYCSKDTIHQKLQCGRYFYDPSVSECKEINSIFGVYEKNKTVTTRKNRSTTYSELEETDRGKERAQPSARASENLLERHVVYGPIESACDGTTAHGCCDNRPYLTSIAFCWQKRVYQKLPCRASLYNPYLHKCARGRVVEREATDSPFTYPDACFPSRAIGCCGGRAFSHHTLYCRNNLLYVQLLCGSKYYDPFFYVCNRRKNRLYRRPRSGSNYARPFSLSARYAAH